MLDPWTVLGWILVVFVSVVFLALPASIAVLALVFWTKSHRDVGDWLADLPERSTWRHRTQILHVRVDDGSHGIRVVLRSVAPEGSVSEQIMPASAIADLARNQGWRRVG